jgi:hypothetical protein
MSINNKIKRNFDLIEYEDEKKYVRQIQNVGYVQLAWRQKC